VLLELVDLRPRPCDNRWCVPPFAENITYEHPHWWNRQLGEDPWFVQVLDQTGTEVARVEFDDPGGINPEYANVPNLGDERLEIQFIEVAMGAAATALAGGWCGTSWNGTQTADSSPTARAPTASGLRWAGSRSSTQPAAIGRCSSSRPAEPRPAP